MTDELLTSADLPDDLTPVPHYRVQQARKVPESVMVDAAKAMDRLYARAKA